YASEPENTYARSVILGAPATGKTMRALGGMTSHIWDIAISPGGDRLAACAQDGTLRTWAVPSGRHLAVGKLPGTALKCLSWSPDGRTIATGDFAFGVTTWDAATLRRTGHAALPIGERMHLGINQVAFTANSKRLISLTDDEFFVTWTLPGLQKVREFPSYPTAQFATDGRTLVHLSERPWKTGTDRSMAVWDLQTGRSRVMWPTVEPFALWRSIGHVVGVTDDNRIAVARVSDGKVLARGPKVPNPDGMVSAVAVSPDGRRIVAGNWNFGGIGMYEVR
ncbi:MAG: repeat-like protein, partial [Alphaproteobacteria bacterium]|nr:repeat-like protein [Alphaproteobacteria bacterium]